MTEIPLATLHSQNFQLNFETFTGDFLEIKLKCIADIATLHIHNQSIPIAFT